MIQDVNRACSADLSVLSFCSTSVHGRSLRRSENPAHAVCLPRPEYKSSSWARKDVHETSHSRGHSLVTQSAVSGQSTRSVCRSRNHAMAQLHGHLPRASAPLASPQKSPSRTFAPWSGLMFGVIGLLFRLRVSLFTFLISIRQQNNAVQYENNIG